MQCMQCNARLEPNATFCGNCGARVMSLPQNENATIISESSGLQPARDRNQQAAINSRQAGKTILEESFLQPAPLPQTPMRGNTPPLQDPPRGPGRWQPSRGGSTWRIAIIGLVVLLVAAAGTIGTVFFAFRRYSPPPNISVTRTASSAPKVSVGGQVAFFDNSNGTPGFTDALKISVTSLSSPPTGSQYDAWLINDQSEQVTPLGTLAQSGGTYTLNFTSSAGSHLNLIGAGNRLEITLEQGAASAPGGKVVLSAVFPPKAFVHIRHLLFRFPTTPNNIGLLVGLLRQTQALNAQALLLQSLAGSGNTAGIQCVAQSIVDISEGSHGQHYQPLSAWCIAHYTAQAGDGFGILGQGYAATASAHAALAAIQSDATDTIRLHARHVEIATDDIKGWVTTVDQDALKLLSNPANISVVQEIVTLSDHAYHGVAGPDGQVNPVPGEAGAITAYIHGQFMASLLLVTGA